MSFYGSFHDEMEKVASSMKDLLRKSPEALKHFGQAYAANVSAAIHPYHWRSAGKVRRNMAELARKDLKRSLTPNEESTANKMLGRGAHNITALLGW
jgi:hypothetical protein